MELTIEPKGLSFKPKDRLNWLDGIFLAFLIICTLAVYLQVRRFDFLGLDDQLYVASNVMVIQGLSLHTLRWALTAQPNGNWHPLTTTVQLIISSLFGVKPGAFHVANAMLHALNAALVYLFLRRATGLRWPAFFTAVLWGLHPLRVESVAWVSELKDVVCGAFWLGCLLAYVRFSRHRTVRGYLLVLLLQVLALLGKPMAVTLPPLLLLLDYWPLSRAASGEQLVPASRWWSFRVLEKLPMLLISLADIIAQKNAFSILKEEMPLSLRLENAVVSYGWYLRDLFFPRHLHLLYPHPYLAGKAIPLGSTVASAVVLLAITAAVVLARRTRPYLVVGWFWFLGALVPVIGLIQVGEQARADRFTYMPSIGIFIAVIWLIRDLVAARWALRAVAVSAGAIAAILLAGVTCLDLGHWKNEQTLSTYLCSVDPNNFYGLSQLGYLNYVDGRPKQAIEMAKRAVENAPFSGSAHGAYGLVLGLTGRLGEAQEQYVQGIRMFASTENWDGLAMVYDKEANVCAEHHNPAEMKFRRLAAEDFQRAVDSDPTDMQPREHLAYQLELIPGRADDAIRTWEQLVQLAPSYAQAQGDLASALLLKGDVPQATEHFQAAIADGAKNPEWEYKLAWLVATSPQASFADVLPMVALAKDACEQTKNQQAAALDAYADCLARVTRFDDAVKAARQAITAANAAHEPAVAAGIQKRLELYEKGRAYVATDEDNRHAGKPATTQATTDKAMNDK